MRPCAYLLVDALHKDIVHCEIHGVARQDRFGTDDVRNFCQEEEEVTVDDTKSSKYCFSLLKRSCFASKSSCMASITRTTSLRASSKSLKQYT